MRTAIALLVMISCAVAAPAHAQDRDEGTRSFTKILIGAGALAIGVTVAAKSSETTTVSSALGTSETSKFSTSQLITGLSIAGVGGIILWDGLRSHDRSRPSTRIVGAVGPRVKAVGVQRVW